MHGGMHGNHPPDGSPPEPGWMACVHPTSTQPAPDRIWEALSGRTDPVG